MSWGHAGQDRSCDVDVPSRFAWARSGYPQPVRSLAAILALSLVAASCGGEDVLSTSRWQVESSLGPDGQVVLELSVVGIAGSTDDADAEGIFFLEAVEGPERVFASVELPSPEPNETRTALTWSTMLPVGEYVAFWGSRDDAVAVRIDVDEGGFGMSSPEPAKMPDAVVPGSVSRVTDEAFEEVRARAGEAELFLAGYEEGLSAPGTVSFEIRAESATSDSLYTFELVGDRLELVSVRESPVD